MCLTFRIRQDHLSADGIAVTLILWYNHVRGNVSSGFVRMVFPTIFILDADKRNILFFCIIMDSFHTGFHCKCFIRNLFRNIVCRNCLFFLTRNRLFGCLYLLPHIRLLGSERIGTA